MPVLSGSPEAGKGAVMESGSPDPDQLHAYGLIDVTDGIWSFFVSMRTWYERYIANAKPGEPRSIPPLYMMLFPRLFEKSWGYDRLYPYAFDDWLSYRPYLKNFDMHNRHLYANSEAYQMCLEMENKLRSVLLAQGTKVPPDEIVVGDNILKCTLQLILSERHYRGGSSLRMNAAKCIAKEAELIIERLRLGHPEEPPNQSTRIRQLALKYMEGCDCGSDVALLVLNVTLLGITKETELMVQNLSKGYYNSYEVYLNTEIWGFALEVLTKFFDVFTASAKMSACYSDDNVKEKFFAEIEADAEQRPWRYLVEYDPASEEASGIQSSEKKQLEEGMVHHLLPHRDD